MRLVRCARAMVAAALVGFCVPTMANADTTDDYVRSFMARSHTPGMALAVMKRGKVVKAGTYGLANLEWQRPVTRSTLFWMDSLTKLFTAVGILELAEQHKLALDDPLSKYLAGTPAAWKGVTLRHLLTYTSGIKDDYWETYRHSALVDYDAKDIYGYATRQPLQARPGTQFSYNNESYYLLGLVITKVTGVPYTHWITAHVLRPAGMATARMYNAWEIVPQMASSYAMKDGRVAHNRADIMSDRGEAIASWGLYASLDDMIAFVTALKAGKLITPKDLELMWSNGRLANGALSPSGIAFNSVMYLRGHRMAAKGGQAGVMYTIFPDDGVSVILLTDMEESDWGNWYDASQIARIFDPQIQPMSVLTPHADPDPARTQRILAGLQDVADGVSRSPRLTPALSAGITPEIRATTKDHLPVMRQMKFLGCEHGSPEDPSGAVQYCYYRVGSGAGSIDLGFGLDRGGRLASPQGQME
jgi:CubicO group peptidase (beta-lactamase class C family)